MSVDYGLRRRALLADVRAGRRSLAEACDAHPYLLLAARHYGEDAHQPCPVCAHHDLKHVHYVFGEALGKTAGQAKSWAELERLHELLSEFGVYVVEVCPDCGWNHLIRSFALGQPGDDRAPLPSAADG